MKNEYIYSMVKGLNETREWGLSPEETENMVARLSAYLKDIHDQGAAQRIIDNYHNYRDVVDCLTGFFSGRAQNTEDLLQDEWYRYIRRVAAKLYYQRPVSGIEVEDVVQSSWLNILKGINTYGYRSRFETWVYQVVVNTHLGLARSAARRRENIFELNDLESILNEYHTDEDPLYQTIRREEAQDVRNMVKRSLEELARSRRTLKKVLNSGPVCLDGFIQKIIAVLLGESSQHELARQFELPEPTVSRICKDLVSNLQSEMK